MASSLLLFQLRPYATIESAMKRAKIKYLVVSLVLISSLALDIGCTLLPTIDISAPSPPSPHQVRAPTNPEWTLPPEKEEPLLPDFVPVVAKIKQSVVSINTEIIAYDVFNRAYIEEAAGSGWIIDEAGYIVTNNHVVEAAQDVTVTLDDGRAFTAGIVGTDSTTDMAVIKIEAENIVRADIGESSKLKVGEWVLAVGNSLNLGVTPSEGIVRSLSASIPVSSEQVLFGLIGTSAAINPGNSGGPLVNMQGEVVGITTVKISTVGVEAMGWAISSETAIPLIEDLIKKGYVVRPWLGVVIRGVDQGIVLNYDLAVDKGVFIIEVSPDSPADEAGLEEGDVIVSMGGEEIATTQDLLQTIHSAEIGQSVEIVFWRGDTEQTTYTILIERPQPS